MNETVRTQSEPILEIENLSISFFTRRGEIPAVMDFSCTVMPGEAMGIVGESGCGKSTVSLGVMRDLSNIGKIVGGRIKFQGRDMGELSEEELRKIRGNKIAMIYQEPMASLNPCYTVGFQIEEVLRFHLGMKGRAARAQAYAAGAATIRATYPARIGAAVVPAWPGTVQTISYVPGSSMRNRIFWVWPGRAPASTWK